MTQEEKAKAYDEAIERAKEVYDAYRFSMDMSNFNPTDIEYIFPQLAESEDEKIRKWLYDYIERVGRTWGKQPFHYEQILAWIEKQKEPENVSAATMAPSCWAEEPSLQKEENKCPEYCVRSHCIGCSIYEKQKEDDEMVRKIITDSVFYQYGAGAEYKAVLDYLDRHEKWTATINGEPIPTENQSVDIPLAKWSDEDIEKNLIAYLRYERKSTPQEIEEKFIPYIKSMGQASVSPMSYGSLDEAMQEAGRRFDLPCTDKDKYSVADVFYAGVRAERESKQEWSDEDKQWLSDVYFAIDHSMYSEVERQAMKEYIDFLRSQSKSAEWGEEDRRHLDRIRMVLESWDRSHISLAGLPSVIPDDIDWLEKKLKCFYPQPHWKPSEEQMEELYNAFYTHSVGAKSCDVLETLYNQLKKL